MDTSNKIIAAYKATLPEAVKQCGNKTKYLTAELAYVEFQRLSKGKPSEIFTVYKCPRCSNYHVGHKITAK